MNKRRIFIGMVEVAGYYGQLAKSFRRLGCSVTFVGGGGHPFRYQRQDGAQPWFVRLYEKILLARTITARKMVFQKLLYVLSNSILKFIMFWWACLRHDVFIFGYGTSFFPYNIDLLLLKFLKKRVICNLFHGSEARPPYIDGSYLGSEDDFVDIKMLFRRTKEIKRKCSFIEKNVDFVIGSPLTSHFISVHFINVFQIGLPCDLNGCSSQEQGLRDGVRILHSPSNPRLKGSSRIRSVINYLKSKGYNIKFVEIIGQPNSIVLEELRLCDFVVDQLYSDTPMAGFATEAAWFGRPAVVGGYGFDKMRTLLPKEMWPPSKTCLPDDIGRAVEDMVVNIEERNQLGAAAQRFVRDRWGTVEVARRYLRLIEGAVPDAWWLDPKDIIYVEGVGMPIERSRERIRRMVGRFGISSLQLSHRPELEQAFLEFASVRVK